MATGLAELFQHFADNWRGWQGNKTWASLEGEISITATSDHLGHVFLAVRLREGTPPRWTLDAHLVLEAGMFPKLAADAREFESTVVRAA